MPILSRINASDEVEGGQSVQDAAAVAAYLEQECGVNALHVTRVVHLHDEFMWAPGLVHGGFNGDLVTEIKRAVSVPVIAVGRFTEPQYAELTPAEQKKKVVVVGWLRGSRDGVDYTHLQTGQRAPFAALTM